MAITVTPETFSFVSFDSAYIARIATLVAEQLGLTDIDIEIAVDETSPLTRIDVEVTDSLFVLSLAHLKTHVVHVNRVNLQQHLQWHVQCCELAIVFVAASRMHR
jgi:hypothetical protein